MFIQSHAIIPVFAFAVLVNFYNFDPTFSLDVSQNFTNCQECVDSPCHKEDSGTCVVNPDNTTALCMTCPEQDGNKQFALQADCEKGCSDPTKCVCDGMCYMCVEDDQVDTSDFVCEMPTFKWDDGCTAMVPYPPPAATPATPATPA